MNTPSPTPPSAQAQEAAERAAFETFANARGLNIDTYRTGDVDHYESEETGDAWEVWKFRASIVSPPATSPADVSQEAGKENTSGVTDEQINDLAVQHCLIVEDSWNEEAVAFGRELIALAAAAPAMSGASPSAPTCKDCNGTGEWFTHSDDCDDDLCALNGDEHSCVGQVERCACQPSSAPQAAATVEQAGTVVGQQKIGFREVPLIMWEGSPPPVGTKLYTRPQPATGGVDAIRDALLHAERWIGTAPHGDNCFVSDHYEGDPGNRCNCGKDSVQQHIESALEEAARSVLSGSPAPEPRLIQIGCVRICHTDPRDDFGGREWAEIELVSPDSLQDGTPVYIKAAGSPAPAGQEGAP